MADGVCVCVAVEVGEFEGEEVEDRVFVCDGEGVAVDVIEGVWDTDIVGEYDGKSTAMLR